MLMLVKIVVKLQQKVKQIIDKCNSGKYSCKIIFLRKVHCYCFHLRNVVQTSKKTVEIAAKNPCD